MMALGHAADIKWWYHFLADECGLRLGQDWSWAWHDDAWAVEFADSKSEVVVLLKLKRR